ncbi:acyl-CoA dehydrogenase family protein [Nocardia abscessus]|uniref:acyl-CoA dehydrogenase family protein n=1 Tax=Nocardia TaxID=1817 RepID=UPI002B4B6F1D|nr:acyl-CoA dehydrogenase family protein [Nocardia abscessus]
MSAADVGRPALELRGVLEQLLPVHRAQWGMDDSFAARLAWQRLLADAGWAAPAWPQAYGGKGLDAVDRVECDREIAESGALPMAGVLGLQNVGPALIMFGDADQQCSLARILHGDEIWVQGFSEPGAGSDLAGLRTRADLRGDTFVVNGQKVWTTAGMEATHMLLLARTDPDAPKHRGISAILVDLDTPGVERRPLRQITGEYGFAEFFFTDVEIPRAGLLGPLHGGWAVTTKTLGYERTGVINSAARLEREVRELAQTLEVRDAVLRDQLTQRWIEARLTALMGARALARLRDGESPGAEQSIIKFAWSQATSRLGETVLDVSGHAGILASSPAARRFVASRSSTIAAGTTEIMRNLLAERVLGLPREPG